MRSAFSRSAFVFLSTPSARRATSTLIIEGRDTLHFYPRPPRGGRQNALVEWYNSHNISIHALREEGDSKNREKALCFCLIIHLSAQIAKRCL